MGADEQARRECGHAERSGGGQTDGHGGSAGHVCGATDRQRRHGGQCAGYGDDLNYQLETGRERGAGSRRSSWGYGTTGWLGINRCR